MGEDKLPDAGEDERLHFDLEWFDEACVAGNEKVEHDEPDEKVEGIFGDFILGQIFANEIEDEEEGERFEEVPKDS